jgi:hypothetical protein
MDVKNLLNFCIQISLLHISIAAGMSNRFGHLISSQIHESCFCFLSTLDFELAVVHLGSVHVNFQFLVMCLFLWTLLALQWLDKLWAMIMENPLYFIGEINLLTCWAITKFLSEWIEEFICSIILLSAHHTLVDFQRDDFIMLFQTGHHIQNHVLISC